MGENNSLVERVLQEDGGTYVHRIDTAITVGLLSGGLGLAVIGAIAYDPFICSLGLPAMSAGAVYSIHGWRLRKAITRPIDYIIHRTYKREG